MFDAVLFDLDETLIPDEPLSHHAFHVAALELTQDEARAKRLAQTAEREARAVFSSLPKEVIDYALRIGHSALEGMWATYDPHIAEEKVLAEQVTHLRPEAWRRALAACGEPGDPQKLQQRWQHLRARAPLFSDVDEVLASLRPHTKLGIITNGVSGLQRRKVHLSGLAHWFDVIAISGEVGIGKPDKGIFDWVAQQLGVSVGRCVMVGDNSERDVQGGINAGMKTAWLDRGFKPRGVAADIDAKSLRALLPFFQQG
ncbi:MAG: HAD family hydrolase [Archangium sp.]